MIPSDLYRAGDRVTPIACTKWFLWGATYEVARDQEPGGQVFLKAGPILELPVDPSILGESYE